MKNRLLLLASAILGIGAAQSIAPSPAPVEARLREVAQRGDTTAVTRKAPAQPVTAQANRPRTAVAPQVALGGPVNFIQKQGPRRVKYGKSRWIVLS